VREVVDYYDRGGGVNPGLDRELRPLRLADKEEEGRENEKFASKRAACPLMSRGLVDASKLVG